MNREELAKVLLNLKMCSVDTKLLPILSYFFFDKDVVVASNGVQGMEMFLDSGISCAVSGSDLTQLIQSYNCKEIHFKQEKDLLSFTTDGSLKSKGGLATLPLDERRFKCPDLEGVPSFTIPKDFLPAIKKCLVSVNPNPVVVNQYGVCMEFKDKEVVFYSTNNAAISKHTVHIPEDVLKGLDFSSKKFLLPELFCNLIVNLGIEDNDATFFIGEDFVVVVFVDTIVFSKINVGIDFLDFDQVISSHFSGVKDFYPVPEGLEEALNRSNGFVSSEVDQFVEVELKKDSINLVTMKPKGTIEDSIPIVGGIENYKFRMDSKLFLEAVGCVDEMCFVHCNDKNVFVGKSSNFSHLLSSL